MALKIGINVAFCLALDAAVAMGNGPSPRRAIVLHLAVFQWSMLALARVVQQDAVAAIFGDGEADGVTVWAGGKSSTLAGIANIAEVLQLTFTDHGGFSASSAVAGKTCAQRQPLRKRPVNFVALLSREKIRTGHDTHILVPIGVIVLDFFLMTEPNRLEMLKQFVEQNPNDAFARYGLAMEYSKLGQTDAALQEFARLLELHPDYSNGYFMAAQALAKIEKNDEAKAMLQKGIESAQRTGNRHALNEMSAMLEELSS
jgi:Tetratricopeptide repeat